MKIRALELKESNEESPEHITSIITTDSDIIYIIRYHSIVRLNYKTNQILNTFHCESAISKANLNYHNELIVSNCGQNISVLNATTLESKNSFRMDNIPSYHFSLNKDIIFLYKRDIDVVYFKDISGRKLTIEYNHYLHRLKWDFFTRIQENIIAGVGNGDSLLWLAMFDKNKFNEILIKEFEDENIKNIFSLSADKLIICTDKYIEKEGCRSLVNIFNIKTSEIITYKLKNILMDVILTQDSKFLVAWEKDIDKNYSTVLLFDLDTGESESFKISALVMDIKSLPNGNLLIIELHKAQDKTVIFEYELDDHIKILKKYIETECELPFNNGIKKIIESYLTDFSTTQSPAVLFPRVEKVKPKSTEESVGICSQVSALFKC